MLVTHTHRARSLAQDLRYHRPSRFVFCEIWSKKFKVEKTESPQLFLGDNLELAKIF